MPLALFGRWLPLDRFERAGDGTPSLEPPAPVTYPFLLGPDQAFEWIRSAARRFRDEPLGGTVFLVCLLRWLIHAPKDAGPGPISKAATCPTCRISPEDGPR